MIAFFAAAALVSAVAAFIDLRTGHIPNKLTLGALALALSVHAFHGAALGGPMGGVRELALSLLGMLLTALVPFIVFCRGGMGGGDVKLFAAIGAACLPLGGLEAQSYAFLAATLLAPAQLIYQGVLWKTLKNSVLLMTNPFRAKAKRYEVAEELRIWFRLGPSIFVGCAVALVTPLLGLGAQP